MLKIVAAAQGAGLEQAEDSDCRQDQKVPALDVAR